MAEGRVQILVIITKMVEGCVQILVIHSLTLMVLLSFYGSGGGHGHVGAMESPPYTVVLSTPGVEVRLYRESSWISAVVGGGTSFNKSTHDGFHRLYQYIHGANEDNTKYKITTPILTTITSTPNGSDFLVSMYMPSKPSILSPQLNLHISNWTSHCIAISTFSGFAQDDNIYKERLSLDLSLTKPFTLHRKNVTVSEDKSSYSIAQYNAPSTLTGRVNEAWINVLSCPN